MPPIVPIPTTTVPVANPITGAADAAEGLLTTLGAAHDWIADRHNWVRVMWFVAGYAMIIGGLIVVSKPAVDVVAGGVASTAGTVAKGLL